MGECTVDFGAVCRLCLAQDNIVLFSLLTGEVPRRFEYPQTICAKIRKLFNINVCADDLPDKICHHCLVKVDMYFAFNEIVEAGQYRLRVIANHRDKLKRAAQGKEASKDDAEDNIMEEPLVPFRTFRKLSRVDPLAVFSGEALSSDRADDSFEKDVDSVRLKVNRGNSNIVVKPQPAPQLMDKTQNVAPNNIKMSIKSFVSPPQPNVATTTPKVLKSVAIKYDDFQKLVKVSTCVPSDSALKDLDSMAATPALQSTSGSKDVSPLRTSTGKEGSTPQRTPEVTLVDINKIVAGTKEPLSSGSLEKEYECEVCSMLYKHKVILLRHIMGHYKDNIYTCHHLDKGCQDKVWFSSSEFKEHLETVHRDKQSFVVTALSRRLKKHAKAVICEICMVTVDCEASLEEHKRKVHKDYYGCKICKKWFTTKNNLICHIKSHKLVA